MLNGFDKIIGIITLPAIWLGSIEWRLRNKPNKDAFKLVVDQLNRVESHQWDMMKAQNIIPSMELPDEIKNNKI